MPEKKVSKLAFENDKNEHQKLYLVGINPSDKIKPDKKRKMR